MRFYYLDMLFEFFIHKNKFTIQISIYNSEFTIQKRFVAVPANILPDGTGIYGYPGHHQFDIMYVHKHEKNEHGKVDEI